MNVARSYLVPRCTYLNAHAHGRSVRSVRSTSKRAALALNGIPAFQIPIDAVKRPRVNRFSASQAHALTHEKRTHTHAHSHIKHIKSRAHVKPS